MHFSVRSFGYALFYLWGGRMVSFSFLRRMDKMGRIVIPRDIRRILGWQTDTALTIRLCEDGVLLCSAEQKE